MIEISLKPEVLFHVGALPITNSMVGTYIITILLILLVTITAKKMKTIPGKRQLFLETLIIGIYDFIQNVTKNEKITKLIFPLFTTLVLFFLFSNLFGLLPGLGAFSYNDITIWRPPTADYATIFILTVSMFILWQSVSLVTGGVFGFIKKYLNFSSPIDFIMGLLDIIGELAKIISLSFRLFGNIFAAEAIAAVLMGLVPYVLPLPFSLLGMIGSVVQAFVFPILVLIFINMSVIEKKTSTNHTNS